MGIPSNYESSIASGDGLNPPHSSAVVPASADEVTLEQYVLRLVGHSISSKLMLQRKQKVGRFRDLESSVHTKAIKPEHIETLSGSRVFRRACDKFLDPEDPICSQVSCTALAISDKGHCRKKACYHIAAIGLLPSTRGNRFGLPGMLEVAHRMGCDPSSLRTRSLPRSQ